MVITHRSFDSTLKEVVLILDSGLFFYVQAALWQIFLNRLDFQRLKGFVFYLTDFTQVKMVFRPGTTYLIFKERKP